MGKKPKKFYKKVKPGLEKTGKKPHLKKEMSLQAQESPRINRSIAEDPIAADAPKGLVQRNYSKRIQFFLMIGLCLLLLGGIIFLTRQVKQSYQIYQQIHTQHETIKNSIAHYEEFVIAHPGSRDAYMQLALLYYQLKDFTKSEAFIQKILLLDPNFKPALALESKIHESK